MIIAFENTNVEVFWKKLRIGPGDVVSVSGVQLSPAARDCALPPPPDKSEQQRQVSPRTLKALTSNGHVKSGRRIAGDAGLIVDRILDVIRDGGTTGELRSASLVENRPGTTLGALLGKLDDAGNPSNVDSIRIKDTDAVPVGDRIIKVRGGQLIVLDTLDVEGRYIKKESIEQITDAEVAPGADIDGSKLMAASVRADRLNLGRRLGLAGNGSFEVGDPDEWTLSGTATLETTAGNVASGSKSIKITA